MISGTQSYIKTSNPISTYALHTLNNTHEYGNADQTITLLKTSTMELKLTAGKHSSYIPSNNKYNDRRTKGQRTQPSIHLDKRHKTICYVVRCVLPVQFTSYQHTSYTHMG